MRYSHREHFISLGITREELECIKNLTEENIRLKRVLKSKDKDLVQKTLNIEAVSYQIKFFFVRTDDSFRFKLNSNVSVKRTVHYVKRIRSP